jgi:hypothetical protein
VADGLAARGTYTDVELAALPARRRRSQQRRLELAEICAVHERGRRAT